MDFKDMNVAILAGGLGTRLIEVSGKTPKSMISIMGMPLLEHVICNLQQAGLTKFLLITSYKSKEIKNYFGNGERLCVAIEYVEQPKPSGGGKPKGRAQGLHLAKQKLSNPFLVVNANDLFENTLIETMFNASQSKKIVLSCKPVAETYHFGIIERDKAGKVLWLREKPCFDAILGVYILTSDFFQYYQDAEASDYQFEDIIIKFIEQNNAIAVSYDGFFSSIKIREDLEKTTTWLSKKNWISKL